VLVAESEDFLLQLSIYLSIYLSICLSVYLSICGPFVVPCPLFNFLILCAVGKTPWRGDQPVARPLPTTTQTRISSHRHPYLEWDSNPRSKCSRGRKVHALDRAATVIRFCSSARENISRATCFHSDEVCRNK
jgi:hypothetical protein